MNPTDDPHLPLRALYLVVRRYEAAQDLGGDSEFLRDAIRVAREVLKDCNWWPAEDGGA